MNSTHPERAEIILEKLGPLPPIIHEAIEEATVSAKKYFEDRKEKPDSYLFPHLVRYKAGRRLNDPHNQQVGYTFVELSNNGLSLHYNREGCHYKIRVRKADEFGELPKQNLSKQMRLHYNNELPFLPSIDETFEEYVSPSNLNLVVVWDVDEAFDLTDVFLVCPRNEQGDVLFAVAIEHSVAAVVGNSDFDDESVEIDDIDIIPVRRSGTN